MHMSTITILFRLLNKLTGKPDGGPVSFIACILHIASPAGIFLVSPYAESLFATMNFLGMLCYARARFEAGSARKQTVRQDIFLISSGTFFALATLVRSNGLFSGLIFLSDLLVCVPSILKNRLSRNELRRIIVTCLAGVQVAVGYIFPQVLAYQEYCNTDQGVTSPWCQKTIPSVYTWVQSKYWWAQSAFMKAISNTM
jgi:phosphatidylinositol glycan class V